MPLLRNKVPCFDSSNLPRPLVGMAQHDRLPWTRIYSGSVQVRYNIRHTDQLRRWADALEAQS